ncbi:MAG: hypothetical protein KatS3mg127_0140 [Silanimonas sp.]|nr:MAG: hypothetical protein KatS3mg127_0140 [Silanimonas sp.]
MHSASEDLVAFRHALGVLPRSLYDTQIAAAFAGLGPGLGYQGLVKALLGVELDKAETRSDWLKRPLSERQLAYAADDVRHLHAAVAALDERLERRGHRQRALADMARMLDSAREEPDDPHPHLGFRPAAQLDRAGQARLRRLLRWREATARRRNLPKKWLLDNELALTLARRPPRTRQALASLLEGARAARRLADEIASLLEAPPVGEELDMPLARAEEKTDRQRLKALQAVVAEQARALDLPEACCAPAGISRPCWKTASGPPPWTAGAARCWKRRCARPWAEPGRAWQPVPRPRILAGLSWGGSSAGRARRSQ